MSYSANFQVRRNKVKNGPKGHMRGNFAPRYLRNYAEFRKKFIFTFVIKNDAEYNAVISFHPTRTGGDWEKYSSALGCGSVKVFFQYSWCLTRSKYANKVVSQYPKLRILIMT